MFGLVARHAYQVYNYALSSALRNTSGSSIACIGVPARQIGYFLNLPDLYDLNDYQYGVRLMELSQSYSFMGDSWGFHAIQ